MTSLLRVLFLPVSLLLLATAGFTVPLPVFLEHPGSLMSLDDRVTVDAPDAALDGDFLLTVVTLEETTAFGLVGGLLDDRVRVILVDRITGGVDRDTYFARQEALFEATSDVAAAVGLEAAGFDLGLEALGGGALVEQVAADAPAEAALEPGDVITAVDGRRTPTADSVVEAVRSADGEPVAVTFERGDQEQTAEIEPEAMPGGDQRVLGVRVRTVPAESDLPVPVEVDTGPIGGPSAGLMIALTVYDKASADVDLAAGRRVAGTGGLDAGGDVEPIGGVAQKVLGAAGQDVEVFLVPEGQLGAARRALPPEGRAELELVGVGSFDEAVRVLRDTGRGAALGSGAG